jgi:hypothetical protein
MFFVLLGSGFSFLFSGQGPETREYRFWKNLETGYLVGRLSKRLVMGCWTETES